MPSYISDEIMDEKLAFKVTARQRQWLEQHARREQRSISQIVRMLIDERMDERPLESTHAHTAHPGT
jgi:hypothetical protein